MSSQDRFTETRENLMAIMRRKGVIYTLGLLIGIVSRLSQSDYNLYREIDQRKGKEK